MKRPFYNAIYSLFHNPRHFVAAILYRVGGFLSDEVYLKWIYYFETGHKLDLKNPKRYNEKLQWIKLYDHNPLYTILADKYKVKEVVSNLIGEEHVAKCYGVWDRAEDIEWDKLPNQFVLKTTHDGGNNGVFIVKDKSEIDKRQLINAINKSLHRDVFLLGREWPYKDIPKRVFAEEYLEDATGELRDYKFFCFDGEVKYLFIATERQSGGEVKFNYFDADFNDLGIVQHHPMSDKKIDKPETFEEMKRVAAALSKGIPAIRVDLYEVNGKVYFGEYTFSHHGGFTNFHPDKWDFIWGDMIKVPFEKGKKECMIERDEKARAESKKLLDRKCIIRVIRKDDMLLPFLDMEGTNVPIRDLYDKYGEDCVHHMKGAYAFILYDSEKKQLFGAVDRMGCKTLYYYVNEQEFGYGTALLPLCEGKGFHIDEYGRQCYFAMQYIPAPHTIVKEVKKLRPGECFTYNLETGELRTRIYWDLYDNTSGFTAPNSYEEAVDTTERLLKRAIEEQVTQFGPSVKKGMLLSGGVDSSIVALYASQVTPGMECFSIGYNESKWDETEYARRVADRLGLKWNQIVCTPDDAVHIINGLQRWYDEPMGDASMIPTSFVCEQAAAKVDMAFGGDGGDEVFFGYPRYLRYAGYQKVFDLPRWVREIGATAADIAHMMRKAKSLRMKDVQELYMNRRPSNTAERFDALKIQQSIEQCSYLYAHRDIRRCFNDFDIKTLMCFAYNVKLDRAAMRAGLGISTPLLDNQLVEYSRLLPIEYCYTPEMGQKRILRELLYRKIPREVFERNKKGFGVPIGEWMRNGVLKDYLVDMLNKETVKLLSDYDGEELLRIRDRHIAGIEDQTTLMWLCVNYIAWVRLFNDLTT